MTAALRFHVFAEEWHEAYRILTCSSADVLLVDRFAIRSCLLQVKRMHRMTWLLHVVACCCSFSCGVSGDLFKNMYRTTYSAAWITLVVKPSLEQFVQDTRKMFLMASWFLQDMSHGRETYVRSFLVAFGSIPRIYHNISTCPFLAKLLRYRNWGLAVMTL